MAGQGLLQPSQWSGIRSVGGGTYYDGPHPLFEDERGVDLLEEAEEQAVRLGFLAFWQLHAAQDVQPVPL